MTFEDAVLDVPTNPGNVVVVKVPKSIEAPHTIAPAKFARAIVGKVVTRENCPVFRQTAVASPPRGREAPRGQAESRARAGRILGSRGTRASAIAMSGPAVLFGFSVLVSGAPQPTWPPRGVSGSASLVAGSRFRMGGAELR